jgi:hypothetical protein
VEVSLHWHIFDQRGSTWSSGLASMTHQACEMSGGPLQWVHAEELRAWCSNDKAEPEMAQGEAKAHQE